MKLPKELTTVTPLSKTIALLLFISLPIVAFIFGINYQKILSRQKDNNSNKNYINQTDNTQKKMCGGIAGIKCPDGYICNMQGKNFPDASGICISNDSLSEFQCPETEYIDCMPGPDVNKVACQPTYLKWAKENCPGFKGAAY